MNLRNILQFNPRNSLLHRLYIKKVQKRIDLQNQKRLTNKRPTLVCSNCTGGFIMHWLGLQFRSPFVNLFMTPTDFVTALENWDEFIHSTITKYEIDTQYPVGQVVTGGGSVLIHFMHYPDFDTSIKKWDERKSRMEKDPSKIGFMLTNWNGEIDVLRRFDALPLKNKVVFTYGDAPQMESSFNLKGLESVKGHKQVYYTCGFNGARFIDQFDYVKFLNDLV